MLNELGQKVKDTTTFLNCLKEKEKNKVLTVLAEELVKQKEMILKENQKDIEIANKNKMNPSLVDRLRLTEERMIGMKEGLENLVRLTSPIGKIHYGKTLENGLELYKKCVPLGVIGVIYESRPNVTIDVFSLCFKTSNAVILKGGKEAIHSNKALVKVIKSVLKKCNISESVVELIEDTSRDATIEFMKLNDYIDVLIPRGGKSLIETVVKNSTIPVIETGTGNCHIYVSSDADIDMAINIIENAKTQRTGVCNACESLVIDEELAEIIIPKIVEVLKKHHVEIRGDDISRKYSKDIIEATEEDYATEYLDSIISIKTVKNIDEAIKHINNNNTKHSEAIITTDITKANKFTNEIDSSTIYVNASTRFTDGFEFGFGAEIGISTQKLHARGPMGLEELTSYKYVIYGNGQIRK